MSQGKLAQIIRSLDRLRPMPTSVERILRTLDNPNASAGMISEFIGLDQALAASVLQVANSAALGYGPRCASLTDAVMRLGFRRIRTVVLGAATSDLLNKSLAGYRLGTGVLWNHSVACGMAAQWLARVVRFPNPEEAYVAGLLHDMGKLILDQFMVADYNQVIELMQHKRIRLWQVEESMFGLNHAAVGGMAGERWRFPTSLVEAITYHHAPSLATSSPKLASIVNIANAFATREEIGMTDPEGHFVHPEAARELHFSDEDLVRLRKELDASLRTGMEGK